jgi:hypothetical protein
MYANQPPRSTDHRRAGRAVALAMAATGLIVLATGCGSASPKTSVSGPAPHDLAADAFRYSACMRAHGLPNFPDPQVSTSQGQTQVAIRLVAGKADVGSPQFKTAQQACRAILPAPRNVSATGRSAARTQDLVAFAKCLRTHGLANFPDPNGQGQLTAEMITAAGIDLHAPNVLPAARACVGVTHGTITMADVARAINNPH